MVMSLMELWEVLLTESSQKVSNRLQDFVGSFKVF